MKTTVKEIGGGVYLVTFGLFKASRALNISYRDVQSIFMHLRNQNRTEDMYGRTVDEETRKKYDGHDHYDLANSPEYVIKAGGLRLDSEASIASIKLEVLDGDFINGLGGNLANGFCDFGWLFIPRCYYETACKVYGEGECERHYVGVTTAQSRDWLRELSVNYNTIDIWYSSEIGIVTEGEDSTPEVAQVVNLSKAQTTILLSLLRMGLPFSTTIEGLTINCPDGVKPEDFSPSNIEKALLVWEQEAGKKSQSKDSGYSPATFTPEQQSDTNVPLDDFPKLGGWKGVDI